MLELLVSLALGGAVGMGLRGRDVGDRLATLTMALVLAVVFVQGVVLGGSDVDEERWLVLLGISLGLAVAVSVASVLAVELVARRLHGEVVAAVESGDGAGISWSGLGPVVALVAGVGLATVSVDAHAAIAPRSSWALWALIAAIGADIGRQPEVVLAHLRRARGALWIVPVMLLCGLVVGAALAPLAGLSPAALGAGMTGAGFYSVAGPVIAELDGPEAGAVVLLANLLRETLGMVALPWLARLGLRLESGCALGGATAMDSTLPFIARGWGAPGVVVAFAVGLITSSIVPLAVPSLYAGLSWILGA